MEKTANILTITPLQARILTMLSKHDHGAAKGKVIKDVIAKYSYKNIILRLILQKHVNKNTEYMITWQMISSMKSPSYGRGVTESLKITDIGRGVLRQYEEAMYKRRNSNA